MAITFDQQGRCTQSGGTLLFGFTLRRGALAIVFALKRDGGPAGAPAGWTKMPSSYEPGAPALGDDSAVLFWKIADGTETGIVTAAGFGDGYVLSLLGATAADIADATRLDGAGSTLTTNPVTAIAPRSLILGFWNVPRDSFFPESTVFTATPPWALVFGTNQEFHPHFGIVYRAVSGAGSYTPAATDTIPPAGWHAFAVAVAEAPLAGLAPSAAQLIVEYFDNDAVTFGPSTLQGVIYDAVKVGWSWYSRYPANAFFTLRQDSIHNSRLNPLRTHIRITYYNPATGYRVVVFTGRLSEPDESGEDVVWTAWNYQAELSLSRTGYRVMYPTKLIGSEIASPEWTLARTADSALLNFVTTGAIEDPLASDGTTPIKTDARFGVIDVPRLLLMFDLTEIGRANTANNVTMGISRTAPFTFTFLKNAGSFRSAQVLAFPGLVRDFKFIPGYASLRNDLATIGTSAAGGAVEIVKTDEANADTYGRRQDVFTIKTLAGLAGAASELDAQNAITERAVKEATSLAKSLALELRPGLFEPFDGWDIEDTVKVQIVRGRTLINATYRIVGVRGLKDARGYHPQLIVQLPTAA